MVITVQLLIVACLAAWQSYLSYKRDMAYLNHDMRKAPPTSIEDASPHKRERESSPSTKVRSVKEILAQ